MEFARIRNNLSVSKIALGCGRMDALSDADTRVIVDTALDEGIQFFDHGIHFTKQLEITSYE